MYVGPWQEYMLWKLRDAKGRPATGNGSATGEDDDHRYRGLATTSRSTASMVSRMGRTRDISQGMVFNGAASVDLNETARSHDSTGRFNAASFGSDTPRSVASTGRTRGLAEAGRHTGLPRVLERPPSAFVASSNTPSQHLVLKSNSASHRGKPQSGGAPPSRGGSAGSVKQQIAQEAAAIARLEKMKRLYTAGEATLDVVKPKAGAVDVQSAAARPPSSASADTSVTTAAAAETTSDRESALMDLFARQAQQQAALVQQLQQQAAVQAQVQRRLEDLLSGNHQGAGTALQLSEHAPPPTVASPAAAADSAFLSDLINATLMAGDGDGDDTAAQLPSPTKANRSGRRGSIKDEIRRASIASADALAAAAAPRDQSAGYGSQDESNAVPYHQQQYQKQPYFGLPPMPNPYPQYQKQPYFGHPPMPNPYPQHQQQQQPGPYLSYGSMPQTQPSPPPQLGYGYHHAAASAAIGGTVGYVQPPMYDYGGIAQYQPQHDHQPFYNYGPPTAAGYSSAEFGWPQNQPGHPPFGQYQQQYGQIPGHVAMQMWQHQQHHNSYLQQAAQLQPNPAGASSAEPLDPHQALPLPANSATAPPAPQSSASSTATSSWGGMTSEVDRLKNLFQHARANKAGGGSGAGVGVAPGPAARYTIGRPRGETSEQPTSPAMQQHKQPPVSPLRSPSNTIGATMHATSLPLVIDADPLGPLAGGGTNSTSSSSAIDWWSRLAGDGQPACP